MMEVISPGSMVMSTWDNALSPPKERVTSEMFNWAIKYPNAVGLYESFKF
jgi:hypothetical protein